MSLSLYITCIGLLVSDSLEFSISLLIIFLSPISSAVSLSHTLVSVYGSLSLSLARARARYVCVLCVYLATYFSRCVALSVAMTPTSEDKKEGDKKWSVVMNKGERREKDYMKVGKGNPTSRPLN